MRRDGNTLVLEGALTMDTVPELADQAHSLCDEGIDSVDFAAVTTLDSAAIALALEIARSSSGRVRFRNLTPAARKLADLYSVADQLALDG